MNTPYYPSGDKYIGEGSESSFTATPADVRSALSYSAISTFTPATAGMWLQKSPECCMWTSSVIDLINYQFIQLTLIRSLTLDLCFIVIGELPSVSIAYLEHSTCNIYDPQYANIAALFDTSTSQQVDPELQRQLKAAQYALEQIDVSYM